MWEVTPLISQASGNSGQALGFPWHSPVEWQEVTLSLG